MNRLQIGVALATGLIVGVTGLGQAQEGQTADQPLAAESATAQESTIEDARLREKLHDRFLNDARVRSYRINVESVGRHVTLRGAVRTLEERAAAIEIATAVPGIVRLTNDVRVTPDERSDEAITNDVLSRLRSSVALDGADISVKVNDQTVELGGTFPTLAALDKAVDIVSAVSGVGDLTLSASVEPALQLSDEGLRKMVSRALLEDGRVLAEGIRVGATEGRVTLEGTAPSLYQIFQAEQISRKITGVKGVENRMKLEGAEKKRPVG